MHLHVPKLFFVERIQCVPDRTGGVGGELSLLRLEMPGGSSQGSLCLGPDFIQGGGGYVQILAGDNLGEAKVRLHDFCLLVHSTVKTRKGGLCLKAETRSFIDDFYPQPYAHS